MDGAVSTIVAVSSLDPAVGVRVYVGFDDAFERNLERAFREISTVDRSLWERNVVMGNSSKRLQFTVGTDYKFGRKTFLAKNWELFPACRELGARCGFTGDKCMLHVNLYTGLEAGSKPSTLNWHADDEIVVDQTAPIVGVSFGEMMRVRIKDLHDGSTAELITRHRQVYAMDPGCQSKFHHCVQPLTKKQRRTYPEEERFFGMRWSLTFRGITTTH